MVCGDVDALVQNINVDKHIRFTGDVCLWVNDWPRVTDPVPSHLTVMVNGKCRQASMKFHTHHRSPNDTPSAPNTPNNTNCIDEGVEHVNKLLQMSSNGNKMVRGAGNHLEPTTAASRDSHSFLSNQHAGAWSRWFMFVGDIWSILCCDVSLNLSGFITMYFWCVFEHTSSIGSGNRLVLSGNKPLPESLLSEMHDAT